MNSLFTIRSMFGTGVVDFFQMRLDSNAYMSSYELQRTNINFQKVIKIKLIQFLYSFFNLVDSISI